MGREVRRVKPGWSHPRDERGQFVSLHDGYERALSDWEEEKAKWTPEREEEEGCPFEDYYGERPSPDRYMPDWTAEEATLWALYENVSEGTPVSPAFETPEELARWLADNGASLMMRPTSSYEAWLKMVQNGWAPSFIIVRN